jgi:hypothetical protein
VEACDNAFDAVYVQCAQAPPPADETARFRQRYEEVCQRGFALPGIAVTSEQLSACASQFAATGCRLSPVYSIYSTPPTLSACLEPGTFAGDASCSDSLQCQSNSCSKPYLYLPDSGTSVKLACGSCERVIPIGQPCGGAGAGQCASGSTCSPDRTGCVATSLGDIGASCIGFGPSPSLCKLGLYCDPLTSTCQPPGETGKQCYEDTTECAYPLSCMTPVAGGSHAVPTCQSPGQAKQPCFSDSDCVKGLVCDPTSGQCAPLTWARSGQPCSNTARCLVGNCLMGSAGATCPVVIPDGQPCGAQTTAETCDAFATCVNGVCSLQGALCP